MSLPEPSIHAGTVDHYIGGSQAEDATDGQRISRAICAQAQATLAVAAALENLAEAIASRP
jgi:hypothetical protein